MDLATTGTGIAFTVKKRRDSEVVRAENERDEFFSKYDSGRKCLHEKKNAKAFSSGRSVRSRRALTWKMIPPEERDVGHQLGDLKPHAINHW